MREMVLNHASLRAAAWRDAVEWLRDAVEGMAAVVDDGAVTPALRILRTMDQIRFRDGRTLVQVCLELRRQGEARDQRVSLLKRIDRAHFLVAGLGPEVEERLRGCKSTEHPADEGVPLVLCAVTGAISVSVPSESAWDRDRIQVEFIDELEQGAHRRVEIDNVARPEHARSIADRHRRRLRSECSSTAQLWDQRAELFPHLSFGPDVEDHLSKLNPGLLRTLVNRLTELDETAAVWTTDGGPAPAWTCKVTPESESLMNDEKLREARRFGSVRGDRLLFEWHARFGGGARIHLRFDGRTREIEIGYIGVKLPSKKK